MPRPIAVLFAAVLFTAAAHAGEGWMTHYNDALARSAKTGKPILADFTGSDWCGWCVRLKKEVFDTDAFKRWAEENVVLLELDYPAKKPQPDWLKQQNEELRGKYAIRGYPTVLILDSAGKVVGRTGYRRGGPEKWIESAQPMVQRATPDPAALEPTLAGALAKAGQQGKALVVYVESEPTDETKARLNALLRNPHFAPMGRQRLLLAHVVRHGEVDPADADAQALGKLAKQLGLALTARHFWVVDPTGESPRLIYQNTRVPDGKALTRAIEDRLPAPPYDGGWIEDYAKARQIAAKSGKPILLDFTGSDWCGWCKKLDGEVFATDEFGQYARENLVLVKLDFPKRKWQPESIKEQNRTLMRQFGVQGFPTIIVLDAKARKIGEMGYERGGPKPWIKKLEQITRPADADDDA